MSKPKPDGAETKKAKVIFRGEHKVGKTSIIRAFIENELQNNLSYKPTNVVSDFSKTIQVRGDDGANTRLQLNIWDAAGEAGVHDLAHLFLRGVQCGVLIFSIDSKRSFDRLDEWKEHLDGQNVLLVLVGSKSDLDQDR